jgi:putative ABC transport system substrate-binding protein
MASHIERRKFLAALGGAAAVWPLAARAQGDRVRRLGVLMSTGERDPETQLRVGALREGLQKLGWTEGRNLQIDYRWGAGSIERTRTYAAELVALKPDVILGAPASAAVALHRETRTIPVVFAQVPDPVGLGMVESLSWPGGNITGFALFEYAIALKWLELLKEIAPHVTQVGLLYDPEQPTWPEYLKTIEATAPSFKVQILPDAVRDAEAIERAIATLASRTNGGLIVVPGAFMARHRDLIIALAARHRLPSIFAFRFYAASGGLHPMAWTLSTSTGGRQVMSTGCSKAKHRPICRCSSRTSSSWSSMLRQRRRLAWRCRSRCSRAPTR